MKQSNVKQVSVDQLLDARERNVRDADNYALEALIDDIRGRGQLDPITVEAAEDGKFYPLKGFRRTAAFKALQSQGITVADNGADLTKVNVIIASNMTPAERALTLVDHGQRRGLTRAEVQKAAELFFVAQISEKDVATYLRDQIDTVQPPTRTAKSDKDYAEMRRGFVQLSKAVYQLPTVAHDACMRRFRGEQVWPKNAEIIKLAKLANEDFDDSNLFTKDNPGPKFTEAWEDIKAAVAKAEAEGTTRHKSTAMMGQTQVKDAKKDSVSYIFKTITDVVLGKLGRECLPEIGKWLKTEIEDKFTPEQKAFWDELNTKKVGVETTDEVE